MNGRRVSVDQRRADTHKELSAAPMVHPTLRARVESARDRLESFDRSQSGIARRAADRRRRMQPSHQVENVHARGQVGADGQKQMLHVRQTKHPRLRRVLHVEIEICNPP